MYALSDQMRCFLSGMPELKLGLNDYVTLKRKNPNTQTKTVEMDDLKFHQCVRLAKFDNDRIRESDLVTFLILGLVTIKTFEIRGKNRPIWDVKFPKLL